MAFYLSFYPGDCQEVLSEPHGTDNVAKRYTFTISSPDEYVTAIDVRAGAWIDAIRLHTNQKSSVWMGGMGGDEYHLTPPPGRNILGVMGTSGKFVGSLGVLLNRYIQDLSRKRSLGIQPPRAPLARAPLVRPSCAPSDREQ